MSVPDKYKAIGDFREYYSGARVAPYLTIFIGGNHEASNHLFELYYGGWVAPNIYYMGAANVIRCGPLRISGLSGIWKGFDYRKPHFERLPYNEDDLKSLYHVRELDVRKLLQIQTQVDVGISHDWPRAIERSGNFQKLFSQKRGFEEDSDKGKLGSLAAKYVLDRHRPSHWLSAHLHCKFTAVTEHGEYISPVSTNRARQPVPDAQNQEAQPSDAVKEEVTKPVEQEPEVQPSQPEQSSPQSQASSEPSRLSAWHDFHAVAAKSEAADNAQFMRDIIARQEEAEKTGVKPKADFNYNVTWKKVGVDEESFSRRVTAVENIADVKEAENAQTGVTKEYVNPATEMGPSSDKAVPAVTKDQSQAMNTTVVPKKDRPTEDVAVGEVKNEDEIDLDSDSDSNNGVPVESELNDDSNTTTAQFAQTTLSTDAPVPETEKATNEVSEDLRNQLPASFTAPKPHTEAPIIDPEFPAAIGNKRTQFIALDKCLPRREFLQLMEIPAISEPGEEPEQRPFQLKYDKEWLAITRAFKDDLVLGGDPNSTVPPNKGDGYYKPIVAKELEWIEENVVKQGRMTIPENFEITAEPYHPGEPILTDVMPNEISNPQTSQFCELIGIENKFDISMEERKARMDAGPRPCNPRFSYRGRGGRGGRGGRRGGGGGGGGWNNNGGGRGRGWGRGGRGGQGRGGGPA